MKPISLFAFMVMLVWQTTTAQTPEHIFVFLNKKADKAELPEEEVKENNGRPHGQHQPAGQRRKADCRRPV